MTEGAINKVLYSVDQRADTTAAEKKTARDNIGAVGADDIPEITDQRYKPLQTPVLQTFSANAVIDRLEQDAQGVTTVHCSYLGAATASSDGLMPAADKAKLDGIQAGAEVNVQADWAEADTSSDAYIRNKPSIPTKTSDLTNDSGFLTAQVNADWNASSGVAEILNKPALSAVATTGSYTDLRNRPSIPELSWQQEIQGTSVSYPADQLKVHRDSHTVTMHAMGGSDVQLGYVAPVPETADDGKVLTAVNDPVDGVGVQWTAAPESHTVGFIDI